jgi:Zn ribbon nucleic-acid-binding protein
MTEMKLYCQELLWHGDDEQGTYFAVVVAPDNASAERLIAATMLNDDDAADGATLRERLEYQDHKTFAEYYAEHSELGAWGDLNGSACPNCTSHSTVPIQLALIAARECTSCGYQFAPIGFGEKRREMEAAAIEQLVELDQIEAEIAAEDDGAEPDGTVDQTRDYSATRPEM